MLYNRVYINYNKQKAPIRCFFLKFHKNYKFTCIIITHKKKTMEYANTLYGITMQESGVSKLVSVRLEDYNEKN